MLGEPGNEVKSMPLTQLEENCSFCRYTHFCSKDSGELTIHVTLPYQAASDWSNLVSMATQAGVRVNQR